MLGSLTGEPSNDQSIFGHLEEEEEKKLFPTI